MQTKRIELENHSPIDIGRSVAGSMAADYIAGSGDPKRTLIVTDREVAGYYLKEFTDSFAGKGFVPAHIIVDGNASSKTLDTLTAVYERLYDLDCSYVIALGGGGVIDIATFAASTFGRGVKTLLVPTTLLSMLESVMMSHATLHFQSQKDIIRVPVQTSYSVIDVAYLKTLPHRYIANGIAQLIQYGLIDNPGLLHALASAKDVAALVEEGLRSGDRIRKIQPELLAFGRDIADAIEGHFRFLKYTPGEALALSLLAMCHSAALHKLFEQLGLPVKLTEVGKDALLKRIAKSLEKQGSEVSLIRIGPEKKPIVQTVPLEAAVRYYDSALSEICHKAGET
ncbi:MAG: iron-containing alcohol dehydrogenase [Oscillospiraceae bacterium]|nr:iron-containing alcohol dehydrogenase [Oscillospiraceae bacterium]